MMEFFPTIFQGSNPTSIFLSSNNKFEDTDVIVDSDSVMGQGQNTIVNIVVNEPGKNNPVPSNIVEDALHQTIQEDSSTAITNLQLSIVNAPMFSDAERENALRVRLHNARADEVSMTLNAK